jgi:hypothetical protein
VTAGFQARPPAVWAGFADRTLDEPPGAYRDRATGCLLFCCGHEWYLGSFQCYIVACRNHSEVIAIGVVSSHRKRKLRSYMASEATGPVAQTHVMAGCRSSAAEFLASQSMATRASARPAAPDTAAGSGPPAGLARPVLGAVRVIACGVRSVVSTACCGALGKLRLGLRRGPIIRWISVVDQVDDAPEQLGFGWETQSSGSCRARWSRGLPIIPSWSAPNLLAQILRNPLHTYDSVTLQSAYPTDFPADCLVAYGLHLFVRPPSG